MSTIRHGSHSLKQPTLSLVPTLYTKIQDGSEVSVYHYIGEELFTCCGDELRLWKYLEYFLDEYLVSPIPIPLDCKSHSYIQIYMFIALSAVMYYHPNLPLHILLWCMSI